ncbi:MAG: GH116 family glycosyl hydrolase, partial [Candidatus Aminicenantales bacterium]
RDEDVPVHVRLEAYNPYIPLEPERSGFPAAVFNWKVKNTQDVPLEVSLAFSMMNPIQTRDAEGQLGFGGNLNEYREEGLIRGVVMTSTRAAPDEVEFGSLAFVTTRKHVDVQTRWYRGGWWDNAHVFWEDFSEDGRLVEVRDALESEPGRSDVATLLVHVRVSPGEEQIIPVFLTWYFPNRDNHWNREKEVRGKMFRNHYARRFEDAWDVARQLVQDIENLYRDSQTFHDILFRSTYPAEVIDAISSQASSLKTNLVIRTEEGKFFGFEGLTDDRGCCPMNCTHVWNYAQTLAFLFPSLERTVRETDFLHNTFDNGYQVFRTLIPLGPYWWRFKPCADGQMGNIVRVYREWKISGDTEWLRRLWPRVKAALEFAWKGVGEVGKDQAWQREQLPLPWDPDKDGIMEGEQHNTYDIEFYGPNTMTGSLYLAALKACTEMAHALGEEGKAREYREIFERGSAAYDRLLWNGEYYIQDVRVIPGLEIPEHLRSPEREGSRPAPKYQYGEGCLSDQLLGQYLAWITGLGYVMEKGHVDRAIASIFRYNFRRSLENFSNVQRVYALNDEPGLLLCSWPRGKRPVLPFVYSDEVWTGIEYEVAALLIFSGHVEEGLRLVKAVRERHRGFNRNPWDEFECGHHYARAMASWAVMLALSGFQFDGVEHRMAFAPKINREKFFTFWSTGSGWGSFAIQGPERKLRVAYGGLILKRLGFPADDRVRSLKEVRVGVRSERARMVREKDLFWIEFEKPVRLGKDEALIVNLGFTDS